MISLLQIESKSKENENIPLIEALIKKLDASKFENLDFIKNSKLIISDSFQKEYLREADFSYWLKRALRRNSTTKMVKYSDKFYEGLLKPSEFRDQIHDGYLDLGIELVPSNAKGISLLPLTTKGTNPALLLDRDGIINRDDRYIYQYENVNFVEGIVDLIQFARQQKTKVVVLTNQSGIGRGYYTEEQMHKLHSLMNQQLIDWNAPIDGWYFSPFHKDGINEFKGYSLKRKPYPAMALTAAIELDLDLENSVMVGDKKSDRLDNLDIKTFFLQGNYDLGEEKNIFTSHHEIIDQLKKIDWPNKKK